MPSERDFFCAKCHARDPNGEFDPKSAVTYKANLSYSLTVTAIWNAACYSTS